MCFHKVPRNYTFMLLFRSIYPGTSHNGGKTVGMSLPMTRGPLPSHAWSQDLFCLLGLIPSCLFGFVTGHLLIQLGLFLDLPFRGTEIRDSHDCPFALGSSLTQNQVAQNPT